MKKIYLIIFIILFNYLNIVCNAATAPILVYKVNVEQLNLRTGPGTEYSVIKEIKQDDVLFYIAEK